MVIDMSTKHTVQRREDGLKKDLTGAIRKDSSGLFAEKKASWCGCLSPLLSPQVESDFKLHKSKWTLSSCKQYLESVSMHP